MNAELAEHLAALPERADGSAWSPNIQAAYQTITTAYDRAYRLLHQTDLDPLRLFLHIQTLIHNVHPVLIALSDIAAVEGLPLDWLNNFTSGVARLAEGLVEAHKSARGR